jgi:hypothetical protein
MRIDSILVYDFFCVVAFSNQASFVPNNFSIFIKFVAENPFGSNNGMSFRPRDKSYT